MDTDTLAISKLVAFARQKHLAWACISDERLGEAQDSALRHVASPRAPPFIVEGGGGWLTKLIHHY